MSLALPAGARSTHVALPEVIPRSVYLGYEQHSLGQKPSDVAAASIAIALAGVDDLSADVAELVPTGP